MHDRTRSHGALRLTGSARERRIRRRLTRRILRALDGWGLTEDEQASVLGLPRSSRAMLGRFRQGFPLPNDTEIVERVGHLLALQKAVRLFYRNAPERASTWMTRHSIRFGTRPIDMITKRGMAALRYLRADLEPDPERRVYAASMNVFADLGLPNPELLSAKSALVHALDGVISDRGLTKAQAADICGIEPHDLSIALRGGIGNVTLDTLVKWLEALGYGVTLAVGKARPRFTPGEDEQENQQLRSI
ncbi:hypothetical protein dsx2_2166 [Desulfovibrio sp. X2]|uniref:helix-turn-helix domain-containing protein n=1 Tax=Desulfovibrio sp. X2 TaxID=941449 RepID=UPI000358C1DE|nr:XRE family transcriptional regulator [Desulfovibrio sp. X2]EPR43549.1 hypothetical protein dsx2_2166 [Desulfovibrio sp. X2]